MNVEKSINYTRQGFEESFKEETFYNRQTRDDKHLDVILNLIKLNKNQVILDLGTGNGFKIVLNVMTEIRFPRKGADHYEDLLREYNREIVDGYGIKVIGDEVFIIEKVLNMVLEK